MDEALVELSRYAPYAFAVAIALFGLYIWLNREKFRSVNVVAVAGISTALVAVATKVVNIPVPATNGYINFGDTMVMFVAMLFGPVIGAFAGGVGSALGDVISGYPGWAPITLIIKGIEGLAVGYIAQKLEGTAGLVVAGTIGGILMVSGYFLFEYYAFGFTAAYSELPGNLVQAVTGIIVGTGLANAIKKRYPEVMDLL
ncbi:ECF transporter S component [Thermococcus sp. 21S9]|uniref:ECF transporter S component n=1 Tax=Thermococcus sp. 21S9 TaxID=1638223 RepID=UPI00143AF622|nr:ECF transporter S component [Thermococcus sp. 21S9]NJE54322.1 ECF transporter S component [Thermococcus sp. 21S9]